VPCVSRFHGIVITMYFDESIHPGRSHFHARAAGVWATYDVESLEPIVGHLPRRPARLVSKWARLHQDELRLNWEMLRSTGQMVPIAPLP
jgi:Domain of unknown function (DUF4160)